MIIRARFEAAFDFFQPTHVLLLAYVYPFRDLTIRCIETSF
jgi:hypothetical protein